MSGVSRRHFLRQAVPVVAAASMAGLAGIEISHADTASLPPASSTMVPQIPASYIIYQDGSTIRAQDCQSGQSDSSDTDATTVIQDAINALTRGGRIFIKAGTYSLSHAILLNHSKIALTGEGESTNLTSNFAGATPDNAISVGLGLTTSSSNLIGQIADVEIADFSIDMRQTSSILSSAAQENYGNGIEFFGGLRCKVRNVHIRNPHTHGIYFRACSPSTTPSTPLDTPPLHNLIENCTVQNSANAIYIDGVESLAHSIQGYGNKIVDSRAILDWSKYDAGIGGTVNQFMGFLDWSNVATTFVNCYAEGYTPDPNYPSNANGMGFALDGAASGSLIGCSCFNCYQGFVTNPGGGGGAIGAQVRNFTTYFVRYPVMLQGGSDDDVWVDGLTAIDMVDSVSRLAGVAILINPFNADNVKSITAINIRGIRDRNFHRLFGTIVGNDAILQTTGNTARYVRMVNGDQTSLAVNPIIDAQPTTLIIEDVRGYNPRGIIPIGVGPSPFTYTNNDGVPEEVYIRGGAVRDISKNSTTIFTSAPATVWLGPGESIKITYSVAPTMLRDRR